jgi:hypothetical protein
MPAFHHPIKPKPVQHSLIFQQAIAESYQTEAASCCYNDCDHEVESAGDACDHEVESAGDACEECLRVLEEDKKIG